MDKKKFISVCTIVLFFLIIIPFFVFLQRKQQTNLPQRQTLPLPTNGPGNSFVPTPTRVPLLNTSLSSESAGKLYELGTGQKPQLSQPDQQVKDLLIHSLSGGSDILKDTKTFTAEYVSPFDEFLVSLNTTNVSGAKADTVRWLEDTGMSFNGICNLPVIFYISPGIRRLLPAGFTLNPLPDGC